MKYVECPEEYRGNEKSLFMAGGISNCNLWQPRYVELLKDTNLVLLNPRRKVYLDGEGVLERQITWEFNHLRRANAYSFWFPNETLCPITLFELGKKCVSEKPFFLGIDPAYTRKRDLEVQLRLEKPELDIVYSLEDLAGQVKGALKNGRI